MLADSTPAPSSRYRTIALAAAVLVLVILHSVGIWGLLFSGKTTYFQELTPFNLLVSNALLFAFHRGWNWQFAAFAVLAVVLGFFAEVVGVQSGLLFGQYQYGQALGVKLWNVPLLIGLNWLMLAYTTGIITSHLGVPPVLRVLLAALLMVSADYLIEPVAIKFDFWDWHGQPIPLSNYLGWFMLAVLLQVLFQVFTFEKRNALAPWLFLLQIVFFLAVNQLPAFL